MYSLTVTVDFKDEDKAKSLASRFSNKSVWIDLCRVFYATCKGILNTEVTFEISGTEEDMTALLKTYQKKSLIFACREYKVTFLSNAEDKKSKK